MLELSFFEEITLEMSLIFGAGGGIRTHEGLRHRISSPKADLKYGTTFDKSSCPFDLNPALDLVVGLGNPRVYALDNGFA